MIDLFDLLAGGGTPHRWDTRFFVVSMIVIVVVTALCLVFRP